MRTSRPQMFMDIARVVARRSTCMRLNVGAVLVQDRSIVSIGYNGAPSGEPHCTHETCNAQQSCKRTTHAEMNAIIHLPSNLDTSKRLDLYVTDSPCVHCFNSIVKGDMVKRIFFATPYRINDHLTTAENIGVYRVLEAGYVIDWRTKELVNVET